MQTSQRPVSPRIAAERLGVHPNTVYRWLKSKQLRAMKTPSDSKFGGRYKISPAEINRFKEAHMTECQNAPAISQGDDDHGISPATQES